ncbi:MAG: hypothetical protein JRD89_15630 [Deltaproteobacteria bacterium]|nr:hypothetical protein [Deltaproteobacteria bacterium]
MGLTKQEIRERLQTKSVWVKTDWTAIGDAVSDDEFRYIVAIWINGDMQATRTIEFSKLAKGGSVPGDLSGLWSPIPIAPADFKQIPEGSYSLEDPITVLEGGTRLYAKVDGNSVNVTVNYWDTEL